jgi:hypothetical protein
MVRGGLQRPVNQRLFAPATGVLAFDFADARSILRAELGGRLRVNLHPVRIGGASAETVPAGASCAGTL